LDYADKLIAKVESASDETLTEQNAHNIAAMIFYDVQVQDAGNSLGMAANGDLNLAVNRLKSLQKLYLFEQKGGENYLGWAFWFLLNKKNNQFFFKLFWTNRQAAPATVNACLIDKMIIKNWWSLFK